MAIKIGRRLVPNSAETFPNKTAAVLVDDDIEFHGAKVSVSVHNAYRSRLFRREGREITIAADRIVRMHEDGVECWLDTHLVEIKMRKPTRSEAPAYHAFVSELPKRVLKRFPLLIAYNQKGQFVGVTIFKPPRSSHRKKRARTKSRQG